MTSTIDTFIAQQNSGRGSGGIGLDYNATTGAVPAGGNGVVGFQNYSFTSGVGTVLLDGPRSNYAIQVAADGGTTIKDIGQGDANYGQSVEVSGESYIVFNGANLAASTVTVSGAPTYPNDVFMVQSAANAQLAQFYAAVLGRAPDLGGLEYWQNNLAHGGSIVDIAQDFLIIIHQNYAAGTPVSPLGDPASMSNTQYITDLYLNILGRQPDSGGLAYWQSLMDAGLSQAQLLVAFTNATATTSSVNATPGGTAGSSSGWLITPSSNGGYADAGLQISAQTVFTQATQTNVYTLSLIDPSTIANASLSNAGVDLVGPGTGSNAAPGSIWVYANAPGSVITLASSFTQATLNNSGNQIHDGPGVDTITINGGSGNFITLGSATTDILNLADGTNSFIFHFTPGSGSLLSVSGAINGTAVSLLDGTASQVKGASLNFGTFASSTPIVINVGSVGGGTAAEVAAAANKAYQVADASGSAASGSLGEHLLFIGTDAGGNAEIWSFQAPLSTLSVNGITTLGPVNTADLNGNHQVDANEITLIATLIGVNGNSLHATDLA